jgi:NADH-quinone oxidoreductase subunit G
MSESMVELTIEGQPVRVPAGTLLVDAAKQAGIDIPVFCYHPKMKPVGMCRMCLVEIGRPQRDRATGELARDKDGLPAISFSGKLETACTTPVEAGWVVFGANDLAVEGRRQILEYLLTSHPLDCPICDKGGECPLQNLTMAYGPGKSRFLFDEKKRLAKHVALGELIFLDRERCIQCGRCVRFQEELVDDPVIGFAERGRSLEIVTYSDPGFDSYFSGNTCDICPVGALTTSDFRFGARPWEMNAAASICPHCPVGCNLMVNTRREAKRGGRDVVKRVMPRQNESVNETWICDKGRFGHAFGVSPERLTRPLVRRGGILVKTTWEEALAAAAAGMRGAGKDFLGLVGGRASNEDLFVFRTMFDRFEGRLALDEAMPGGEWTGLGPDSNLGDLGSGDAIVVFASDLREEAPIWWMRVKQAAERGATLIVAGVRPTRLEAHAAHTLRFRPGEADALLGILIAGPADPTAPGGTAATALAEAANVVVIFGREGLTRDACEDVALAWARWLSDTGRSGKTNNGLLGVWPRANTQGAWDLGLRPFAGGVESALEGMRFAYFMACDPVADSPAVADRLRQLEFLVVQDLFLTATAGMADVVLPAQSFLEREGSLTSGERRVQRFYPVVAPEGEALPDWRIVATLSEKLGVPIEAKSPSAILGQIASHIPDYGGTSYPALAAVAPQWPPVGGEDLFFGGTSYKNQQGLGLALPRKLDASALPARPQRDRQVQADDGMLLVPVTRLYDQGTTLKPSGLLDGRRARAMIELHPEDAGRLGMASGMRADFALDGRIESLEVMISAKVPPGLALIPRSVGIPVEEPVPVSFPQRESGAP